ncbi:D-isomer specific 2-hydroxyacid dehydrogenase NAD-binding [Anaeromyxobacter dehalogenans 2CP-1]|uniref:D-isomer specific 2-hydroxyacid dehydrogenase NAD-binding n=1 Tax=Anaeromyxobacter dehalogenans (strain ATCC BAA-258 / DSM 21875 / 2CP-1) TaxID=455488 RepID=B8JG88_ANAD2|nr:3-phosphoglycerate dehydrogenase family protein [Anaeromyxobacter dehalogenans]ACL66491.1 D-isomer specific 2-hydroxyacid dehydrogenase NAD-binding [Anaeromyxobacter dehalogenans 2CP-1]
MKILVADAFPADRLKDLAALGLEVELRADVPAKDLPAAVAGASILVVRSKQVSAEVFERAPGLSLVVRAGAGVNTIDVAAASRRGVYVTNCPGQNSIAVAELAIGLLVALDRRIPDNVAALRAGRWDKKRFSEAEGLFGRTLGIAGVGAIGREVAARARALGMRVVAWSRSLDDARARALGVERAPDLLALARASDALSLHLPLARETRGVISRDVLEALRPGALLVNTARAELVDQDALLELATAGRLRVGADVFAGEPEKGQAEFDSPLAKLPGVYGTHHIGASTAQAQDAIARETVRIVEAFVRSGQVPSCVNVARKTPARARLVVRHVDRVGVIANVMALIREAGINAQEIRNTVFDEAVAASCAIDLDERPPEAVVERIRARVDEILFVGCFDL